ncbi:MAG: alpha-ribazole phosphatase family protein [Candidatus Nitricoxidivorans perseverans]|uniref:Alpha-ribazole phosphatase family protein n=1 Tax=Candidatus Nitricoxidivorans perseverans TaxID=2975601 RepID=A0AA49FJE0_9PROT|nr:MAG: alpha-ribazole phosphatase family protein [Candidatus Nitricoxidivorans perseverans]
MELWLIRHPEPEVPPGVCYGQSDLAVREGALESALRGLSLPAFDRLRTSPARRCRELARRLHDASFEDARLSERHFGAWEGRNWDEIGRCDRALLDAWATDPWGFAPPGGESARMLVERVDAALREEAASGGVAVWVTHQGVVRAAAGLLLGLPDEEWMTLRVGFGEALRIVAGKKETAADGRLSHLPPAGIEEEGEHPAAASC